MGTAQFAWLINSLLTIIVGFFVRMWMRQQKEDNEKTKAELKADIKDLKNDIKELKDAVDLRVKIPDCKEVHHVVRHKLHDHASVGTAGEVVR